MASVVGCVTGKMGNTKYYQVVMPARELVNSVRAASELDEWANMGIEERMQRELDVKRVRDQIAPYIARQSDRFFGAIIILIYRGDVTFEGLEEINVQVPAAYRGVSRTMGFLTIDGGTLIVLDGQHRVSALRSVIDGTVTGPFADDVPSDELSVIFIDHEENQKTRRIFNKVNRYAKTTNRGDNIITDEDDPCAITARQLLSEGAPLGNRDDTGSIALVNWRSNTLAARSTKLTTISVVAETIPLILAAETPAVILTSSDSGFRPEQSELDRYYDICERVWNVCLAEIDAFRLAVNEPENIPNMRDASSEYSLLLKPIGQLAMFQGLMLAKSKGADLRDVARKVNSINWAMDDDMWEDILVRASGSILTNLDARNISARLIYYLVYGDHMTTPDIENLRRAFNRSKGFDYDNPAGEQPYPLPDFIS